MGMEVVGSEMAQVPVEKVAEVDNSFVHEKENGKVDKDTVNRGSHEEEPVKAEGNGVADAKVPKHAADEWPSPPQTHTFWFVRFRPFDDPKIKAKIDQADREVQKHNQARFQITEELKVKRSEFKEASEQIRVLRDENVQYKTLFDEKRKEMEPLQQALGKLRTNNVARGGLCSSEEELNDLIKSLQYHMQHESISLQEEKQILREIRQLEGTREKVVANSVMRAQIQDSLGQKEAIQDQVKLMGNDLDGVRKEQQSVWARITQLKEKKKALDAEIDSLQNELAVVTDKRDKAVNNIKSLRQLREEGNIHFYNSRKIISTAKELAVKKDTKALEELSTREVDKFMSLWCNDKAIRDDYEKRLLPSLDSRQLSRDGRIRNPDEKPLAQSETSVSSEPEPLAKANPKVAREDPKPAPSKEPLPTQNVTRESNKKDAKSILESNDVDDDILGSEKQQKSPPPVKEIDEETLKALKREEEAEKKKQAADRRKKLEEKNARKAAAKALKEAEKKQKEKEKKLRKKAAAASGASAETKEPAEPLEEAVEPEKAEVQDEPSAPVKEKSMKENPVRQRIRPRGTNSLPKAISRRKKSNNYWMWAGAGGAALLLIVLLALGYYYSSQRN